MLDLLRVDAWAPVMQKFNLTQKKKFSIFFYSLIILAFLLDFYVIHSSFAFFSYTLIFAIAVMLNEKKFYEIEKIEIWEVLLGLFIIISSFTLVTPVKWMFVPGTRVFGVFNGGVLIIGYFILFYGLRKYKTVFPFLIFYGAIVTLNGTWGFVVNDFAQKHIAPISSHLAYSFLKFLGYPVSISGTTITIISQSGTPVSATVAGACSGIMGMTLSTIMLVGLLMGSRMKYVWRLIAIVIASVSMFFINIFRLSLIFIAAYYYEKLGLNISHKWLGNIMFLIFILSFWYVLDYVFLVKGRNANGSSKTD